LTDAALGGDLPDGERLVLVGHELAADRVHVAVGIEALGVLADLFTRALSATTGKEQL
jgi:hypothetical protein